MISKFISALLILLMVFTCVGCTNKTDNVVANENTDTDVSEQNEEVESAEIIEAIKTEAKEEIEIIMYFDENDVITMAKVLYVECRGVPSTMEQACVVWTACNRVDDGRYGNTIYEVLTAEGQFAYYSNTPVDDEMYNLALDVLTRWNNEKNGFEDVGRVLPSEYLWFGGDGEHNWFRNSYTFEGTNIWDYSYPNPYED